MRLSSSGKSRAFYQEIGLHLPISFLHLEYHVCRQSAITSTARFLIQTVSALDLFTHREPVECGKSRRIRASLGALCGVDAYDGMPTSRREGLRRNALNMAARKTRHSVLSHPRNMWVVSSVSHLVEKVCKEAGLQFHLCLSYSFNSCNT